MDTKRDLVRLAMREARIIDSDSGGEVGDWQDVLERLDLMVARWLADWPSLELETALGNWPVSTSTLDDSLANVPKGNLRAVFLNLAVEIAPQYGKQLMPATIHGAAESLQDMRKIPSGPIKRRRRQRGAGGQWTPYISPFIFPTDQPEGARTPPGPAPTPAAPRLWNFTIGGGFPLRIDVGSSAANGTWPITFDVSGVGQIAQLDMEWSGIVSTETASIAVPATDGEHTENVAITGLTPTAEGRVRLRLVGSLTSGAEVDSNVIEVPVVDIHDSEKAYWKVVAVSTEAEVDALSTFTAADVEVPGSSYTISVEVPAGQYLAILEPSDRQITSIMDNVLNTDLLPLFTRRPRARQINDADGNPVDYSVLELRNTNATPISVGAEVRHG